MAGSYERKHPPGKPVALGREERGLLFDFQPVGHPGQHALRQQVSKHGRL